MGVSNPTNFVHQGELRWKNVEDSVRWAIL